MNSPILKHLLSYDPLSDDAIQELIDYREEDSSLDYKLELDPDSEREWLEITKDVSAFANTDGGYLVFGIRNRDKVVMRPNTFDHHGRPLFSLSAKGEVLFRSNRLSSIASY